MEDQMASFTKMSAPQGGVEPWGCPRLAGVVASKPFEVSNTIPNGNCMFAGILCSRRVRQVLRAMGMELSVMALRTWLAGQMAGELARQVAQDTCYASDQMPPKVAGVLERHGVSVCLLTIGMEGTTLSRLDGMWEEPTGTPLILVRQGERQHFDLLVTDEVDLAAASAMHEAALANEAEHAKGAAADQSFLDALSKEERQAMLEQFAAFEAAKAKEEEEADRRLAEALQQEMDKEEQDRAAAHAKAEKATALFLAMEAKKHDLQKAKEEVETLRFLLAEGADVASELSTQEQRVSQLSFELSQLMAELL